MFSGVVYGMPIFNLGYLNETNTTQCLDVLAFKETLLLIIIYMSILMFVIIIMLYI